MKYLKSFNSLTESVDDLDSDYISNLRYLKKYKIDEIFNTL